MSAVSDLALPDDDQSRWERLLAAVGLDALLVVIDHRMGETLRSRVGAEDVLNEALLHAWRDRSAFHGTSPAEFRSWLLAIASNRIRDMLDWLKAGKRLQELRALPLHGLALSGSSGADAGLPSASTTPARMAYHRERAEEMRKALASLEPAEQEVLRLRLFEDQPMPQVAAALGIKLGTAWARFRAAAEKYRFKLRSLRSSMQ